MWGKQAFDFLSLYPEQQQNIKLLIDLYYISKPTLFLHVVAAGGFAFYKAIFVIANRKRWSCFNQIEIWLKCTKI